MKLDANKGKAVWQRVRLAVTAAVVVTFACTGTSSAAVAPQKSFSSAEDAVKTAVAAARSNNDKELLAIFRAQAKELIYSGDPIADKQRRAQFLKAYDEKNRLVAEKENTISATTIGLFLFPWSREARVGFSIPTRAGTRS